MVARRVRGDLLYYGLYVWNGSQWETSDENIFKDLDDTRNHIGDLNNPHSVNKTQVGLGNVDNTSDVDKPVSIAEQAALDLKLDANGLDMSYLASTGLKSGGVITPIGGVNFSISNGEGSSYNNGNPIKVTWTGITGAAIAPGNNYISIDENGLLDISASYPDDNKIKLGFIYTNDMNTAILGFSDLAPKVENIAQQIQNFYRRALGTLVTQGTQVVEQSIPNQLELTINSGESFAQGTFKSFSQTNSFTKFIQTSDNGFVIETGSPANVVNVNQYNDVTQPEVSALVNMTAGYWKKDLILRASNGLVLYIYGDSEWATEEEAASAPLPNYPDSVKSGSVKLASIVVEQGSTSIANGISDLRPILSRIFDVGLDVSLATAVDHGALTGLGDDDHPQYFEQTRGDARYYRVTNPSGFETPAQLDSRDTANRDRTNHTGTQLAATISDFASTVRVTVLTGLSTASSALVTAADSILTAIGKLQSQVLIDKFGLAETATVVISGTPYVVVGGMTYTAKKTGTARISFTCTRLHSSSGIADGIGIFINGTSTDIRTVATFSNERHSFSIEADGVAITAGDVITIRANDNGAGTHSIFGRNLSVNIISNNIIIP